jgi:aspartate aminotransferase
MIKEDIKISKRAEKSQFSPIRKFVPLLELAKKNGLKVFELHIGQPDLETPRDILKEIRNFKGRMLSYTNSLGILETREAWQKYFKDFGINFDISEIIVTTGASEALLFSLAVICDAGEEVIVFEPFFSGYNGYASILGVKLKPVRTLAKDGFHLPKKEKILKKITKKTKGILICNPNNPTGTVYEREELKMIAEIAKEKKLFVISDETYREFIYDGKKHYSMMEFLEIQDRVILVDSVSKKFSACGMRIGCLASKNKKVIEGVTKFAQARLSSPMLEQLAVIPILRNSKKYTSKIVKEYEKRRNIVFEQLQKIPGIFCLKPSGAFYITVKLPIKDSDDFAKWLVTNFSFREKTVMVSPASGFYATPGAGRDEIRIAFVLSSEKLKESMEIFDKALKEYLKVRH